MIPASSAIDDAHKSTDPAGTPFALKQSLKTTGVPLPSVPMIRVPLLAPGQSLTIGTNEISAPLGHHYVFPMTFADDREAAEFQTANAGAVDLYANPELTLFDSVCPVGPVGFIKDVEAQLRLDALHAKGHRGQNVRVAVVDSGIDGQAIDIHGGKSVVLGLPGPGQAISEHGTMVAFDVQIGAPDADILDFALFGEKTLGFKPVLSDAIRVFAELLTLLVAQPGPLVVVNSWGMSDRRSDLPVGHPGNYSANPRHPFNLITAALAEAGADIFFAAGNCGGTCPFPACGERDRGPGRSILGANSHPDVTSVSAVTVNDDVLGSSSEGPGALFAQKPDLAASSHFLGSRVGASPDSGTSAACAVAAGVAASLRSKASAAKVSPTRVKHALLQSAQQPNGTRRGWNAQTGWGIIDAPGAAALL